MLRTLIHHWRINLAVVLGAAVACAVLAGALLVGDSVRGSLRSLTLERLGAIDQVMTSPTFFREALGEDLFVNLQPERAATRPTPAILLRGSATEPESGARALHVAINGVDERFTLLFDTELDLAKADGQFFPSAIVNRALARELGLEAGDALLLSFGSFSHIPRGTLMGDKDPEDATGSLRVVVTEVIPDRGVGRFGLTATQASVANVFVDLQQLQEALELEGQANALLMSGLNATRLAQQLQLSLKPEDVGVVVRRFDDHLAVESRRFVLDSAVLESVQVAARKLELPMMRTQTYLANEIRTAERSIPYSTVAALTPLNNGMDWATLRLTDGRPGRLTQDDGILLNTWTAAELDVEIGDSVELAYFEVDANERLSEKSAGFRVDGIVVMQGLGADRSLVPEYPGLHDADDMSSWDPPFPVDLDRIRTEDELYWDRYGATPKAFVTEQTGARLWSSRYGNTTSVLLGPEGDESLDETNQRLVERMVGLFPPESFGFIVRSVREEGLRAAAGATDFSMLFLGFSIFLIVSAALLVGLLFRLGIERRSGEIGLLLAVGYSVAKVRRRLLIEGGLLAALGGLLGLGGAIGFAGAMMLGLRTIWRPAVGSSELFLHVTAASLAIGWGVTLVVVLLSIYLALRKMIRIPPPLLLMGVVAPQRRAGGALSLIFAWGGTIGAVLLMATALATSASQSPGLAFGSGSLLLIAGLAFFSRWCRGSRRRGVTGALTGMAARNSSWNPGRSALSVALVASASFMIIVVEVFRVQPDTDLELRDSGSGGYRLVAEADVPIHQDLNRPEELAELGFDRQQIERLAASEFQQARLLLGDDASCNNLYLPERPSVMGVAPEFIRRGGFRFKQLADRVDSDNPWVALESRLDGEAVPAIVDANSAQWILKKKLGEELAIDDELGGRMRLQLVGFLDRSLFRSELIVAEQYLLEHFPSLSGDSYFMIETPAADAAEVTSLLESNLAAFGFDVTSTQDRIAGYEAVQNTYLSTFQVLGGLGLLLGTFGLGIVLVRNVIERRGELATLRAFGYRRSRLAWIVVLENAFLLLLGVSIGALAALVAVLPSLSDGALPGWPLLGTLALVVLVGMLSSVAAVVGALRIPLLPALKAEH